MISINTSSSKDQIRILVMAGGTGGHIYPALCVAFELMRQGKQVSWLGTEHGPERNIVKQYDIAYYSIAARGIRMSGIKRLLLAPFMLGKTLLSALGVINKVRPSVVFGAGGYVTGPGGMAAWLKGIPLVIHEQNAIPGLTNKILAKFAKRVLVAYEGSFGSGKDILHTGNPVREDIIAISEPSRRLANHHGAIRILVLGGSQGARIMNETAPEAMKKIMEKTSFMIWHQCGKADRSSILANYGEAKMSIADNEIRPGHVKVSNYIEDMASAYSWADLVIARAGAMTVAEVSASGLAAWFVPYPFAVDDHQRVNAMVLKERGAAKVILQEDFTAEWLHQALTLLPSQRKQLLQMAVKARSYAKLDASKLVAEQCLEVAYAS